MNKYPLVRTIYLYLFALIGLVLVVIGMVRFVNMGLKMFVFKNADEEQRLMMKQPSFAYMVAPEKLEKNGQLSEDEVQQVKQMIEDYKQWKARSDTFDYVRARREEDAAISLAMILVGVPLYLYHWGVIKKETKDS